MSTIVFDVNETLSDTSGLAARFESIGAPASLAPTWFAATLRDGFALAVAGMSASFADIGRDVAHGLLHGVVANPDDAADDILDAFTSLDVHPDVIEGLRTLHAAGHRLVTLSVGSASVAETLLERAGVADTIDLMLSCDDAGLWKPHPAAYRYAARRCGVDVADTIMVAVHPWDLDGAHRAGLTTAYIDRTGAPWPGVFAAPDHRVTALAQLADRLES